MSMHRALQWILGISLFGVAFSGTLTYQEVFGKTAAAYFAGMPLAATGTMMAIG